MRSNRYNLTSFVFLTYHKSRVVIYGYGPWYYHVMDWLGMNIYHGRLKGSPVFEDINQAKEWLLDAVKKGEYKYDMQLTGHHAGEHNCSKGCDDREIEHISFRSIEPSKALPKQAGEVEL